MEATDQSPDGATANTVDVIISEFNKRLGDGFESTTNHDSKEIIVTKIPESDKEELTYLLTNQGYEVDYES